MRSIYLLNEEENDYYKIGISNNPKKRIKQLQTGAAGLITLRESYVSQYASKIERALHRKYSTQNIKGEWFKLDYEQVKSFVDDCKQLEKNFASIDSSLDPDEQEFLRRTSR